MSKRIAKLLYNQINYIFVFITFIVIFTGNNIFGYIMKAKNYLVIIGDIVKSRELKNRGKFQNRFAKALRDIRVFGEQNVVSDFVVTIGDEFQGVLDNANKLFSFFDTLEYVLDNSKFRYGIGVGRISTKINPDAAIGMDGPAFYNARASLEKTKKQNLRYYLTSDTKKDTLINTLMEWLGREKEKWTKQRKEIIKRAYEGQTQTQIAKGLNISQPAISKTLKIPAAHLSFQTEQLVEEEINKILAE